MKKLLTAVLLFSVSAAQAVETMSFGEVMKAKALEMKAVYALTWVTKDGEAAVARHAGGMYLPINTLQSADGKSDYMDWGIGVEEPEGSEKPQLIVPIMGNVFAITRKIFSFRWAKRHIRSTTLPAVWFGPIWHPPTKLSGKSLKAYKFKEKIGIALSIRFSGPWFLKDKGEE